MEVLVPGSDFSFDSRNNSQYDSAPESPRGFKNHFFSAPTTPNYQHLNYDYHHGSDEKYDDSKSFSFIPCYDLDLITVSSTDELSDGGKIKPCEPKHKRIIHSRSSFRPKDKVCSEDFTIRKENVKESSLSSSSSSRSSFGWLHKKWRLKDLLSRNASEGHETNKKYDFLRKIKIDDLKDSNISSTNSVSSLNKKNKAEKATLSAHERHYKMNRAAAEEMKKRTYLPYKQNLTIGCMNLDVASVRDPSRATLKIR